MNDPANRPWPHGDEEPNESLDRENYEIINSMGNCPNCGARMGEERTQFGFQTICPVCQTVKAQIQLRVTMARKNAYVKAAKPRKLTEWIFSILDKAAGYEL